ncbi:MAG: siphovirus Gp157 family protein [Sphingomonadaceae bacterium]
MAEQQTETQALVPPPVPPEEEPGLDLSAYRSLKLYELAPAFVAAMAMILEADPSTQEGQEAIELAGVRLSAINLALEAKFDGIGSILREFEASSKAIGEEIARLSARKAAIDRRSEGLKAYALSQLKRAGLSEVNGTKFTFAVRLNPEAVQVVDQAAIPRKYIRIEISESPDKNAIKAAHKAGEEIPGVVFTRGERLEIR